MPRVSLHVSRLIPPTLPAQYIVFKIGSLTECRWLWWRVGSSRSYGQYFVFSCIQYIQSDAFRVFPVQVKKKNEKWKMRTPGRFFPQTILGLDSLEFLISPFIFCLLALTLSSISHSFCLVLILQGVVVCFIFGCVCVCYCIVNNHDK